MSVEEYVRSVERARVLGRIVEADPADVEARLALANLRRAGLDVVDYEWVLGFDPAELDQPAPVPLELEPAASGTDEWAESIMEEALGFISVGLKERALPLLEIVLHMRPDDDVARSWLFALKAETEEADRPDADATLRIDLRR